MNESFKFGARLLFILKGFSRTKICKFIDFRFQCYLKTVTQSVFLTDDVSIFHLNSS